ncbi:hypothetical protein ACLKA6_010494 [Drosophila palustris]
METMDLLVGFSFCSTSCNEYLNKSALGFQISPRVLVSPCSPRATASSLESSGLSVLLEAHFAKVNPAESNISTNCLRIESNSSKESAPDIQQSLLPQDQLSSPCSSRTFSDPCCRRINSAVLALAEHPAILAAAGLTQQSLLWQDIQRSLLPQDQLSSPCFGRTFSDPCCRRINSAVLALAGHSAILAAAGFTQQSLLWQNIQRSLLPQDQLSSPCFGRTFSDPCCRRINSAVLALVGHPVINPR